MAASDLFESKEKMLIQGRLNSNEPGMTFSMELDEMKAATLEFYDDMSGKRLNPDSVRSARREEMVEVHKHRVYTKVPIRQCLEETGRPPVGVRWVDVNKGDDQNPDYRSRLVAQELKRTGLIEDLFAATPPLEAKKILFSMAVTEGIGFIGNDKVNGMKMDFIDVRRAYFHANARRRVFVKLPQEDACEGMCGLLEKSMYGTRDAAQNWEVAYAEFMWKVGFRRGEGMPCVFHHPLRNLRVVVHGDDFTILGHEGNLDWFRSEISKRFEVKFRGRIGPGQKDGKSIRLLNRVFEWTREGITCEADQRHAELLVQDLGLKKGSKGVVTPGTKSTEFNDEPLNQEDATRYRSGTARANYLAQDRSDIQYAVKELSRGMSAPTREHEEMLKRLARYLVDKIRVKIDFKYQCAVKNVTVYTDTDFAGCVRTRKSTSGGVVVFGSHMVKSWSTTQNVVALSSGEAEYYGLVKGGAQAIGFKNMMKEMGVKIDIILKTDASAAKGIATRRGMGKVRHIEVTQLWLQDKVARGEIKVEKIDGAKNIADQLTKYVTKEGILYHMERTHQRVTEGRHELMPEVAK